MDKPSRKRKNPITTARRQRVPATPAWFAVLEHLDPHKATITRAVLDRAERPDVCTVCGDVPAPVVDLVGPTWLPLRLCADCPGIRAAMFGEHVVARDA